jgi:MYXO-CTERM domain-containing protein
MRRLLLIATCILGVGAPTAHAAGGPVPPVQGGAGVSAPGSSLAYIAVRAGHDTVLQRVRRADGVVERSRLIRGSYGVPGAAYDGSNTGLSFDEHTLVLAAIRERSTNTRLLTLDARSLRPRAQIVLPGHMTVDAISPDGRWLYLIRYRSVRNNRYDVLAYDLARRHLLPTPIVDPREPDEKMQGFPLTRTVSADGRWAYTLYANPEGEPFIHALDTERRTAACIDLDDLTTEDASDARLVLSGGTLRVEGTAAPLALVDTRTFAVRDPAAKAPPVRRVASSGDDDGGGVPWFVAFIALLPLAGLAVVARRRRHASSA